MEYPYQVINPEGACVLQAAEGCRHSARVELDHLEAGYTIKFHDRKLTKTEIRKEVKGR